MQGSFKVGTVAGIEVRVHSSWLVAFLLIAWSLAVGYFPNANAALSRGTDWVLGIVGALLLFASVLVHELGHSVVARARGLRVENITLFIFGGVSSIAREATTAKDEFLVAVVGPLISLLLAAVFWFIAQFVPPESATGALATYLAFANFGLGVFNLLPGFPLDGGRVLRSIIWATTGDMGRATRIASYVGQAFAFAIIAWGAVRVFDGDVVGGLWIAFTGWFLNTGAEASREQASPRGALHGGQQRWPTTPVGEVMTRTPLKTLTPESDLSAALELMVNAGVHQLPVVQNGVLVGMLSRADIMPDRESAT